MMWNIKVATCILFVTFSAEMWGKGGKQKSMLFYRQHFYKQRQAEIGKKLSKG